MNRVIVLGRLGADPDIRHLGDGEPVANFTLATDESYKQDGKKVERTEWHRIVAFNRLAEVAQDYMSKGRLVLVEGKLRTRQWEDKDKVKRWTTEIVAQNFRLLDRPPASDSRRSGEGYSGIPEDDVPF